MTKIDDESVAIDWLVDEIAEELDAGPTGLYQFVWTLRGRYDAEPLDVMARIARQALERLMDSDPSIGLVWLEWLRAEPIGSAKTGDITDRAWRDIGDDPYLGIVRPA